ncbi:hypothetical protein [Undibacterium sp. TJN19]|uniref:hypothetical protein n=1 Tax=Undibacterium sp. TJN19 TaxID=3413055 RepID=UPI003BF3D41A
MQENTLTRQAEFAAVSMLEVRLNDEIRRTRLAFLGSFGGAIFAVAGLGFLMWQHIMAKSVAASIIGIVVFGLAAISFALDWFRLRQLQKSGCLGKPAELTLVEFSYRRGGRQIMIGENQNIPKGVKAVRLQIQRHNGETSKLALPAPYARQLLLALRQYFPALLVSPAGRAHI